MKPAPITEAHIILSAAVENKAEADGLRAKVTKLEDEILAIGAKPMLHQPESFAARRAEEIRRERECEEVAKLRAEVEHYKFLHQCESDSSVAAFARAEKAEAELAKERARTKRLVKAGELVLGWFAIGAPDVSYVKQDLRAAIDAAMQQ